MSNAAIAVRSHAASASGEGRRPIVSRRRRLPGRAARSRPIFDIASPPLHNVAILGENGTAPGSFHQFLCTVVLTGWESANETMAALACLIFN